MLKQLRQRFRQLRLRRAGVLSAGGCPLERIGDWTMWSGHVRAESVVYGFGVGYSIGWDLEMIRRFGCTVHAFDPTPVSIAWVRQQALPQEFAFHDYGIAAFDGELDFYPPRKSGNPHFSQERRRGLAHLRPPVRGRVYRLAKIMQMLGHERIDVLKLDVEGSEFEAIPDLLASGIAIDQLLVEIHYQFRSRSFGQGLELIAEIKRHGLDCIHVSPRGYEFAFLRRGLAQTSQAA